MFIKKAFLILVLILFCLSFVNAVDTIDQDIGNYPFIEKKAIISNSTVPQHYVAYKDSENFIYTVIIKEYSLNNEDEFNIDVLAQILLIKVGQSNGTLTYGDNIIYIGENSKDIFWASANFLITILNKKPKNSAGQQEFPDEIINAYLDIYPSECQIDNCYPTYFEESLTTQEKLDLDWFRNPASDVKSSDYYTDKLVYCTEDYDKLKLKYDFTEEDIQKIQQHCENNNYFRIEGAKIPQAILECGVDLIDYMESKSVENIDYETILDECIIRQKFKQDFPDINNTYLLNLFEARNKEFMRDLSFIPFEEEINNNSNISNRSINEPVIKKRNPQYFRNESNDLDEFRSRLEATNPDAISEIENYKRGDKPTLDIPTENESNFRGLLRKLFGWLPWFKK